MPNARTQRATDDESWRRWFARTAPAGLSLAVLCFGLGMGPVYGTGEAQRDDLLQLSLEELGRIKVTTVSRKSEPLSNAAAAVHVITAEDLRRSGATSIPEALRMAPGLDVARANARQWAISSRGFNDLFANKLLVLMDGRTVYTPLFSGVFWEDTDTVLEDVERIEVIRGPGATLWGANAVNGVINVISKNAQDTQGLLISGGGGAEERGFGTIRYGGQLGSNAFYRVYGKYADHDAFTLSNGRSAEDSWWKSQWGFRADWQPDTLNHLTWQGDFYYGDWGGFVRRHSLSPPRMFSDRFRAKSEGANLLGRWRHQFSSSSDLTFQMYYDRTDRGFGIGREIRDTLDLDAQHRFAWGGRQEIIWGAGFRRSVDDITGGPDFTAADPDVGIQLMSAFLQDEVAIVPERLDMTLGVKLEDHEFSGFEAQPSLRLAWTPTEQQTVWGAVSRAVRTPSRAERSFQFYSDPPHNLPPLPLPALFPASGSPDFGAEELIAWELGYRVVPHPRLSLDVAVFYNDYDNLYNVQVLPAQLRFSPAGQPYVRVPITDNNDLFGETYGAEFAATWQSLEAWRLRAHYTFLRMNLHTRGPIASRTEESEGDSPQHQAALWLDADLARHVEWRIGLRFVDHLPGQLVGSYTELETRLAWRPTRNCEIAIIGRDLLQRRHQEFSPFFFSVRNVEVDRALFGKVTLRF